MDDVEVVGFADRRDPTELLHIGDETDLGGLAGLQVHEEDIRLELGGELPRVLMKITADAVADDGLARLDRRPFRLCRHACSGQSSHRENHHLNRFHFLSFRVGNHANVLPPFPFLKWVPRITL